MFLEFVEELDLAQTTFIVAKYLLGQGWQLIDAPVLAAEIWSEVKGQGDQGETAVRTIHTLIWLEYAALLHDCCHQSDHVQHQQAWQEFSEWLHRQSPQLTPHPYEQQEIVQNALLQLQQRLLENPLRAPRAFLGYGLQVMRNKQKDWHRRRTAQKRGSGQELSLEEVVPDDEGNVGWEEKIPIVNQQPHQVEMIMSEEETRHQLIQFFQQYLRSEMQQEIAIAYFVDDLKLKEIAALLGKKPHEVRLTKARITQKLRNLPPEAQQHLFTILDYSDEGGRHDD